MIPVIGIPYLSNYDLLEKCIESIPQDRYGKLHIIDNSPSLGRIEYHHPKVVITRMHHNIGVAAAWNLIVKLNPTARWWAIFNSDLVFSLEDIDRLIAAMKVHDVTFMGGMHAFGVRATAIQKVGWFDESFIPAYCEDIDWHYRARLMDVHVEQIPGPRDHFGSATIKRSEHYRNENARSYPAAKRYYIEKWGGFVGEETYTTPFDRGGSPRDWTLDITRLANLTWKE